MYILAWGIKNITYGITHILYIFIFEKKIMSFVDWGRVIGYFHSDSNFFKHF